MPNTRLIPARFTYHRAARLQEALELLARLPAARVLAGGTDLLIQIKTGECRPEALVQVLDIPELAAFSVAAGTASGAAGLTVGAAVPLYRLEEEKLLAARYTALHEAVRALASVQIRTMATLGGNLCNASPSADTAGPLIVLGAEAEIAGLAKGQVLSRRVEMTKFFTGPGVTVLKPGELLAALRVPEPPSDSGSAFIKLGRVTLDMAKVSASAYVERDGNRLRAVRLALGGAAPRPVRALQVEKALSGAAFSPSAVQKAVALVQESISPIDDVRSTAEYRRLMAPVVLRDAILAAWQRAGGEAKE
jgi:carbon-monoxide dehydrogenase medium subunit